MTDTNTGLNFRQRLLAGTLNGTNLELELADANKKASFNAMINNYTNAQKLFENPTSFLNIFASATAWGIVKTSGGAIDAIVESLVATKIAVENTAIIQEILQSVNFYNSLRKSSFKTLKLHINNSYSKLKRQIFYTSGSFAPAVNIALVCTLLIAGGGGGKNGVSNSSLGGGGGELKVDFISSLVAGTYPVIVGEGGLSGINNGNSIFSNIIANVGHNGYDLVDPNLLSGVGGGITTNNGIELLDLNIEYAVWQFNTLSQKGADHGKYFNKLSNTTIPDTLFIYQNGQSGIGLLGGGFPNYVNSSGNVISNGENGNPNTGNGGGGANANFSAIPGIGGSGLVILYYIEA